MSKTVSVLITSFILTIVIFIIGIMINYGLDFMRVEQISRVMENHELDTESYLLHNRFMDYFGGDTCTIMKYQMLELKKEVRRVGIDMSYYTGKTIFKRWDFEYLRRKFFILQLKFFALANKLNDRCGTSYIPILFFYEIDDDLSERQGFVLDDVGLAHNSTVAILSFDKDYDEEPLIKVLIEAYNISSFPAMIIGDNIKFEGIRYFQEINVTIQNLLADQEKLNYYGYAYQTDFSYVPKAVGLNVTELVSDLDELLSANISEYAKGDILLAKGHLTGELDYTCEALKHYDAENASSPRLQALIYETYAAVGCGRNRKHFLVLAADIWDQLNNTFRANLDRDFAYARDLNLRFDTSDLDTPSLDVPDGFESMIIGSSSFTLDSSDMLVSQVDRVTRDWLSGQMNYSIDAKDFLTTFSERLTYDEEELLPLIGWHEGALIRDLKKTGLEHATAFGTIVAQHDGRWYAPNEDGVFMFEVPLDKVLYPTTRFLRDDIAIIMDTHGINMLVEQAISENASVVIGCCDHPDKVKAAKYLSDKGIKVICPTDKYMPLILGSKAKVLGSPPLEITEGKVAIAGGRPLSIDKADIILVENVSDYNFVPSYYDTPARYFSIIEDFADFDIRYFDLDSENSIYDLVEYAGEIDADVIAVRIFNVYDYEAVRAWLKKDDDHRAVLFHSVAYPHGKKLFAEFPGQTSFDDINPVFT